MAPASEAAWLRRLVLRDHHGRDVIALARASPERAQLHEEAVDRLPALQLAAALPERLESIYPELFLLRVLGLGDAVAVEEQRVARLELHGLGRVRRLVEDAEDQPAGPQQLQLARGAREHRVVVA